MSGTAYGTVVLHTAPEAAAGGPLALVENGDVIVLDVAKRMLSLEVADEELARRKANWTPPSPPFERGYSNLALSARHPGRHGLRFGLPGRLQRCRGAA